MNVCVFVWVQQLCFQAFLKKSFAIFLVPSLKDMFRPTEGHILRADNSEECVSRRPASRTSDRKGFYRVFVVNHLKLEANGSARKADF